MKVQAYLNFDGRCQEAIDFYKRALGAEVEGLIRFKDSPAPPSPGMVPPGAENKVLHACFRIGETQLMASDCHCAGQASFQGFSLAITVPSEAAADKLFTALSDGGNIQMPLAKTFFSPRFGVIADRFGLCWMIVTAPKAPTA